MKAIWSLVLLCFLVIETQAGYLRVRARKGDGIHVLLSRYKLDRNSCNYNLFYKLNKLKRNDYLIENRLYYLPIKVYKFSGKSIRSSVDELSESQWDLAKQIERFNDGLLALSVKPENFRSGKRELWVPHHLLACPSEYDHLIPKTRTFPIFGKAHQEVSLDDTKLAGAVYYIVAGHGGPDPGAVAKKNGHLLCEDEYAYDIALRLARKLLQHGALVYLITRDDDGIRDGKYLPCDEDERCWYNQVIPLNQKARLTQRSDAINELYKENKKLGYNHQRTIVLHVDSRSRSERIDLFFYHHPSSFLGKQVSERLHETMEEKYREVAKREYTGTVTARDLHMLRETEVTTVFVEVANIQNPSDQKRVLIKENRQLLANWLTEGLLKDY